MPALPLAYYHTMQYSLTLRVLIASFVLSLLYQVLPSGTPGSTSHGAPGSTQHVDAGTSRPGSSKQTMDDEPGSSAKLVDPVIHYSICTSCGYRGKLQEHKAFLESYYGVNDITVTASTHSPGALQQLAGTVLSALQWSGVVWMLAGSYIRPRLPFVIPAKVEAVLSNKMYMFGLFFVCGQLASRMGSSGAFEVSWAGQVLHSKLQTGVLPSPEQVVAQLDDFGFPYVD